MNNQFSLAIANAADDIALAEHAAVIRALGKRVVGDVIEIGSRLSEAKRIAGHGGWLPWLEREFGWSEDTAERYIQVNKLAGQIPQIAEFSVPVSGLYLLAAPSTPEEVQQQIVARSEAGETFTHAQIKEMIAAAQSKADERLTKEQAKHEAKLAKLLEKYEADVARLRADLGDALSAEEVEAAINDALAPLQAKIKRLEDEKAKRKAEAPRRPDPYGTEAVALSTSLQWFAKAITITPDQMVEHFAIVASATNQTIAQAMAEVVRDARNAKAWLDLLAQREEFK